MTERLPFHFSLSRIGEGNGNLLQCSCLENPRDRGAWWDAVYGVAQSRTRLKWLSSSSSSSNRMRESVCSLHYCKKNKTKNSHHSLESSKYHLHFGYFMGNVKHFLMYELAIYILCIKMITSIPITGELCMPYVRSLVGYGPWGRKELDITKVA